VDQFHAAITTATGDLVLIERKDRPYEPGLSDTAQKRVWRVIDKVRTARVPAEPGACRVLSVGFQHLVPSNQTEQVDRQYASALRDAFSKNRTADLPEVVIIEHLGLEPVSGGERNDFFSPQPVALDLDNLSPQMERVLRLLVRGLGA
jgi:hypothetical protein